MDTTDIESAFRILSICKSNYWLFDLEWQEDFYFDFDFVLIVGFLLASPSLVQHLRRLPYKHM